ncbi:hypothetical protein BDR05DRAFT_959582, partial [Suillus weaverae]
MITRSASATLHPTSLLRPAYAFPAHIYYSCANTLQIIGCMFLSFVIFVFDPTFLLQFSATRHIQHHIHRKLCIMMVLCHSILSASRLRNIYPLIVFFCG